MKKERKRKNIWILIAVIMLGAAGFAVAPYLLFDPEHSGGEYFNVAGQL